MKTIRLPNDRLMTMRAYVQMWRMVLKLEATHPDYPIVGWDHTVTPAKAVLRDIRHGCQDRINRHDPRTGRKHDPDWQAWTRRLSRMLRDHIVIRKNDIPTEFRKRLGHLAESA